MRHIFTCTKESHKLKLKINYKLLKNKCLFFKKLPTFSLFRVVFQALALLHPVLIYRRAQTGEFHCSLCSDSAFFTGQGNIRPGYCLGFWLMRGLLIGIFLFWVSYSGHLLAQDAAVVRHGGEAGQIPEDLMSELAVQETFENFVDLVNENFILEQPLVFQLGAEDGPLYDGNANQILMPYWFVQGVYELFEASGYDETGVSAAQATTDTLLHVLFHELAHALVYNYDLPIVGREEDAADALATILVIELFEQGQEIVLSAADLFELERDEIETFEEADFWDEHSLDAQRSYSALCLCVR